MSGAILGRPRCGVVMLVLLFAVRNDVHSRVMLSIIQFFVFIPKSNTVDVTSSAL